MEQLRKLNENLQVTCHLQLIKTGTVQHGVQCCESSWSGHSISLAPSGCRCACYHLVLSGMKGSLRGWLSLLQFVAICLLQCREECISLLCFAEAIFQLQFFLCHYFSGCRTDGEVLTAKRVSCEDKKCGSIINAHHSSEIILSECRDNFFWQI